LGWLVSSRIHGLKVSQDWWLLLTPLKNMTDFVTWDDDIPNIWKNKKCPKPPTKRCLHWDRRWVSSSPDQVILDIDHEWLCRLRPFEIHTQISKRTPSMCLEVHSTVVTLWTTLGTSTNSFAVRSRYPCTSTHTTTNTA
jgi:hypothetical protein